MSEVESKLVRIVKDSHPDGYMKKIKTNQIKRKMMKLKTMAKY